MMCKNRWVAAAWCCFFVLGSNGLYAESLSAKTRGMGSQSLAESVDKIVQIMSYVDTRLLSDENVARIEASGNYEAIAILHRSLSDRELIEAQINQGRFETAYVAMKAIGNRVAASIKLSWANEQILRKVQDGIDSERAISEAYLERAKQTGIHSGAAGKQALVLYQRAQEKRFGAQLLVAEKKYDSATVAFKLATKLLQKAITQARRKGDSQLVSET